MIPRIAFGWRLLPNTSSREPGHSCRGAEMEINLEALGELSSLDWAIICIFVLLCTAVAVVMRGRLGGTRGFFLANRELPWVVVCLSLISTEISAASFVGVPQAAYGGSLMYLQLAIGAI